MDSDTAFAGEQLTPRQVRAGRALLAWSQQDLARAAGIAASTVADFERGKRTPVPQNSGAMRSALEGAGISFPPEGAVVGPPVPALAPTTKTGAPIRWVNATDLAQWAERRDGQGSLPVLLAKLARAASVMTLHFPSDEGVQYAGWDGTTRAASDTEYVPAGICGWEVGTQRDNIAAKANEDFDKRTKDPLELNPHDSTFIFVTPRHWSKKEEWAKQKRAQGIWRDVRAYDGTDLVHWIELYPAVGQWLAAALGKRPTGARQVEELWLEWSLATQWQLSPELILADRDEDAAALLRWVRGTPSPLALQSGTPDEVAAFVYAAINQLPPDAAEHYLARGLVAANSDVARLLADSVTPLIIVVFEPDPGVAQAIVQRGHHVLSAYGENPNLKSTVRKLERPSREGIEIALVNAGVPEAKAQSFARESSRSLAVLRRLMPSSPGRLPKWAQNPPSRPLLAALLAGAWDESSEADQAALSQLSDLPYADFVAGITSSVGEFDSPLRKVGTIWKVASPQDSWFLLASHLSAADITRFQTLAIEVLGAADPRYELKPDERWYAPIKGVKPQFSEYLRHGLGEVLIMLALFGDRVQAASQANQHAELVVRKLLHNADAQRWWSLSRDFQLLAEAAPGAFLAAVEDSLEKNDPPIAALFGSDESRMFGTEHLSNLLWALESLAWAPEYLGRVSNILARLDELDPGGRYLNRPANSMRVIFLLWSPQTNASLSERLRVLDQLRRRLPAPSWKLMLGILPSGHDSFSPTPPTRWRDLSSENLEEVTYALIDRGGQELVKRLLTDVKADAARWITLIDRWSNLPQREAALEQLKNANFADEDSREMVWDRLRRLLHHHRSFPGAEWCLPETELAKLQLIYDSLTPADAIKRVVWLFATSVTLPNPEGGWVGHDEQVRVERRVVAKSVLETQGLDGVLALAGAVDEGGWLGVSLVESGAELEVCEKILHRALKSARDRDHSLAHGLIITLHGRHGDQWADRLLKQASLESWGEKATLTVLRALPANRWTWSKAAEAGPTIEKAYWERVPIHWLKGEDADAIFFIERLIAAGRARHAVHFIGFELHQRRIPESELLVRTLLAAVNEPLAKDADSNSIVMFQHYVAEILKQLDKADDVSTNTMLTLEWAYLPLLERAERPAKVIMRELAANPELFVQVICAVYAPAAESGVVEAPPDDMERARKVASHAYRLLRVWDVIPGMGADGQIDGAKLEDWVKEVRKLTRAAGRDVVAEQKIGEVLSSSPVGEDGIWPALPVRELLETVRSSHMQTGLLIGRRNRRGATMRLPRDGGAQERALAKTYREWMQAAAAEWPRTSAVLDNLAKSYDEDAHRHDEDAERLDWRF